VNWHNTSNGLLNSTITGLATDGLRTAFLVALCVANLLLLGFAMAAEENRLRL
jgi:hypothetical protein